MCPSSTPRVRSFPHPPTSRCLWRRFRRESTPSRARHSSTRTTHDVRAPRVLLCLPRRRLQGDQDPSTSVFMRRIASHRARARWSTRDRRRAIVVAVWITGARIFAARANRARCAARDGATFAVRCGICVYEYFGRVGCARGARWWRRRSRTTWDRSIDRCECECAVTDGCELYLCANRRPSLSPRRSRLTSTRNSVPTRVVVSPRSFRSVTKRTPSVK